MQSIDVNGTKVAFVDEGRGQPVVLLHSSTGSKGQWRTATSEWANQYRVIAPDLLGYGDTGSWRGPHALTLADEVEIVAAVIDRTDCPVHLVGHSYGGAVALHTAMKLGSRVASLCLVEPTAFYLLAQVSDDEPQAMDEFAEIGAVVHDIGESVAAGFPMAAARRFIDYWCGDGAWSQLSSDRKWRISSQIHKVQQDFHALVFDKTQLTAVAALKMPVLILSGTNSPRPPRTLSRIIAQAIPGAFHRTVPYAGHMLPLTHATTVNAHIWEHMQRVDHQTSDTRLAVVTLPPRRGVTVGLRFAGA
jgi:pimeloyl-ACP methyl ester carboxylesterase